MSKVAFVFPGQGSQKVGMGKEFYENYPDARETLDNLSAEVLFPLKQLMFEGPEAELTATQNAQPALYTASIMALNVLTKAGVHPDFVAGHSLGEYSALAAAGVFRQGDGLLFVRKRGELMAKAGENSGGAMSAVLGLDAGKLEEACKKASAKGIVGIANYNSNDQIVISGQKEAVEEAGKLASEAGAKRVIPLPVSGAFHSAIMKPASAEFEQYLADKNFHDAKVPVITNIDAKMEMRGPKFKEKLAIQIYDSVRWTQSIEYLISEGVTTFVEVGSGKVLSGLIKKINRDAKTYNTDDVAGIEAAIADLKK